jgi:uncharacterized protein (DUF4415 family)
VGLSFEEMMNYGMVYKSLQMSCGDPRQALPRSSIGMQPITLRLDADLIDWFKTHPVADEGYQTSINLICPNRLLLLTKTGAMPKGILRNK